MTAPFSRNAAPVIRHGQPSRPAQLLVHSDSPSVGIDSKGFLAGTRHLRRRGAGPAGAFRNSRPLLALVTPGSRCQALASGDGGVDGDETPQVSTSHSGTAILILCRCRWAFSPAPSAALLALVPTVQPKSARCKHRPRVDDHLMCPKRPWRPLLSANDHPARHVGESHLQSAGVAGLATRIVTPHPHGGHVSRSKRRERGIHGPSGGIRHECNRQPGSSRSQSRPHRRC